MHSPFSVYLYGEYVGTYDVVMILNEVLFLNILFWLIVNKVGICEIIVYEFHYNTCKLFTFSSKKHITLHEKPCPITIKHYPFSIQMNPEVQR